MGHSSPWRLCLPLCGAWLLAGLPAKGSSFRGVVLTESGNPISAATVRWSGKPVCVPSYPHGTPICAGPRVTGFTRTASDGTFAAENLPADTYTLCVSPPDASRLLSSCEYAPIRTIELGENEERANVQIVLRSGSLVVLTVKDPLNATAASFLRPFVVLGESSYYIITYDSARQAFTRLIPKGLAAHLFFDTLLVIRDSEGKSVPIAKAVLPFTSGADEVALSVEALPAVVNAASYMPGISQGTIAAIFGSGFTDSPGTHIASGFPLPVQLAGTSVTVNGIPAPLLAVVEQEGQSQINFQVPRLPHFTNQLAIVVDNQGKQQSFSVRDWPNQLGVFRTLAHDNGDAINESNPARPGEIIKIYWTGLHGYNFVNSPGNFYMPDGAAAPENTPCVSYFDSKVDMGGLSAEVTSCSAAPGLAGIGQLLVKVPPGLPSRTHDVTVRISGVKGNLVQVPVGTSNF